MAKNRFNCMFMLPPELTGKLFDTCGVLHDFCIRNHSCIARVKHTPESRKALAAAIEIVKANGGKYPVDTERGNVI